MNVEGVTMYLTFEYYATTYGGTKVSEIDFPRYEAKAQDKMDYMTLNRVIVAIEENEDWIVDKIRRAMCETIDLLKEFDVNMLLLKARKTQAIATGIKTESIKSHSVTFVDIDEGTESRMIKESDLQIHMVCYKILMPTGLMYRGL